MGQCGLWRTFSLSHSSSTLCVDNRDVRKPNFCTVSVFKNPNRNEAKRSNPKFQFPWLFSKPNLSHTNSQYLSHSHKALTFFTLRTQDSGMIGITHTQERPFFWIFFNFTTDLQRKPNQRFFSKPNWNRTEPAVFLKTELNLKNPFCASLVDNKTHINCVEIMVYNTCTAVAVIDIVWCAGDTADWILRPCLRWGLRSREPVRHCSWCACC